MGFTSSEIYQQSVVPFSFGDLLVFYSDGITETCNPAGEFYGEERLLAFVKAHAGDLPDAFLEQLLAEIGRFRGSAHQHDDLTCVLVSIKNPAECTPLQRSERIFDRGLDDLDDYRSQITDFLSALPAPEVTEEGVQQFLLALTEAMVNVIKHGTRGEDRKSIRFRCEAFEDRIDFRIFYRGVAFDRSTIPIPTMDGSWEGGYGVFIMDTIFQDIRYMPGPGGEQCLLLRTRR
ncbi:MAG: SpoIIE family protein phosphatase [Candidatus Riflebacteria bacterium]|nr:SpoIIE family protein phosphatase [Candidatus Riflebacteria bacterium]